MHIARGYERCTLSERALYSYDIRAVLIYGYIAIAYMWLCGGLSLSHATPMPLSERKTCLRSQRLGNNRPVFAQLTQSTCSIKTCTL